MSVRRKVVTILGPTLFLFPFFFFYGGRVKEEFLTILPWQSVPSLLICGVVQLLDAPRMSQRLLRTRCDLSNLLNVLPVALLVLSLLSDGQNQLVAQIVPSKVGNVSDGSLNAYGVAVSMHYACVAGFDGGLRI